MSVIEKHIEVDVPVSVAYHQWTRFEEFPRFMDGVDKIERLDDRRLQWHVSIGGVERTFEARIEDQDPDRRIAWRSTEGEEQAGTVTFEPIETARTRVHLKMTYAPQNVVDKVGAALEIIDRRVAGDLEAFKAFIEEQRDDPAAADAGHDPRPGHSERQPDGGLLSTSPMPEQPHRDV